MHALRAGNTGSYEVIDETDHRILEGLSKLDYSSYRDLARLLELPYTTHQPRVRSLEKRVILSGFAYGVDCGKFGMQVYRVLVYGSKLSRGFRESLYKFCSAHDYVFVLIECVGTWEFELKVEVPSPGALTSVMNDLYDRFGEDIATIKCLAVLGTTTLAFYPFQNYQQMSQPEAATERSLLSGSANVRPAWD